jgi:hypothetical protein
MGGGSEEKQDWYVKLCAVLIFLADFRNVTRVYLRDTTKHASYNTCEQSAVASLPSRHFLILAAVQPQNPNRPLRILSSSHHLYASGRFCGHDREWSQCPRKAIEKTENRDKVS